MFLRLSDTQMLLGDTEELKTRVLAGSSLGLGVKKETPAGPSGIFLGLAGESRLELGLVAAMAGSTERSSMGD